MLLGAHESIAGGYTRAVDEGVEDGCACIQVFTKNQTQWRDPVVSDEACARFVEARRAAGIAVVMSHGSYLVNLASDNGETRRRSLEALRAELARCARLGVDYLVIHPGAHMGQGEERGLALVAEGLGALLGGAGGGGGGGTQLLLETTAGQGSSIGCRFEQLAWIIAHAGVGERIGVCLDTCHADAAGYRMGTRAEYEATMGELDRVVGLSRLKAFHLNDSKKAHGSRVDRHEQIGKGTMGLTPFGLLLGDPRFASHPGVLETPPLPGGERGYKENLSVLRGLAPKIDRKRKRNKS